jgi:hypothetical protein
VIPANTCPVKSFATSHALPSRADLEGRARSRGRRRATFAGFAELVLLVEFAAGDDEADELLPPHAAVPVNTITIAVPAAVCRICIRTRAAWLGVGL